MPRAQMQGTTVTGGGIVPTMQRQITSLETRLQNFERQILGTGGGGGGNNRAGQAGGVRRRRTTRAAGGSTGGGGTGGLTNRDWIASQLQKHAAEGMLAPQLKQLAIAAGRTVGQSFPYDGLRTMTRNHEIRQRGNKYFWVGTAGGTGTVTKAGTARTRTRRKAMARAARAAG